MRKIGAIVAGVAAWYAAFLLLQFSAYRAIEGVLSGPPVDAALGVLTSLGSIAVAQYPMRKILPSLGMRQVAACLGAAVASTFVALVLIKGLPANYGSLVSCLFGALAAFAIPLRGGMPDYSLKRAEQSPRD